MFSKHGSNFNWSTKKEDIASLLEAIWVQHQQGEGGGKINTFGQWQNAFEDHYLVKYMDKINDNIAHVFLDQQYITGGQ